MTSNSDFSIEGGLETAAHRIGSPWGRNPISLDCKSRCSLIAFLIAGVAGAILVCLASAELFGRAGSIGFSASMAGGGTVVLVSLIGIIAILRVCRKKGPLALDVNLPSYFSSLARKIKECPPYQPQEMSFEDFNKPGAIPTRDFASLFIHAHEILPHVFLGDYRGFLSVDPEFVKKYPLTDKLEEIFNGKSTKEQNQWAEQNLDYQGCSDKNIRVVISVTQFKSSVQDEEWSTFRPDLDRLGITRIEIPVDDVDGAWTTIEPRLDEIFEQIDLAIQGKGNCLIHCVKGASRSAAVIYAYLMNRCGVKLDQAYNYVQSIRHQVELKSDMRKHLEAYEKKAELKFLMRKNLTAFANV